MTTILLSNDKQLNTTDACYSLATLNTKIPLSTATLSKLISGPATENDTSNQPQFGWVLRQAISAETSPTKTENLLILSLSVSLGRNIRGHCSSNGLGGVHVYWCRCYFGLGNWGISLGGRASFIPFQTLARGGWNGKAFHW